MNIITLPCVLNTRAVEDEWRDGVQFLGHWLIRYLVMLQVGQRQGDTFDAPPIRTQMVWTGLDTFGEPSKSEMAAVLRSWDRQQNCFKDAWENFRQLVEKDENWGTIDPSRMGSELGGMFGGGSFTEEDLSRAQAMRLDSY